MLASALRWVSAAAALTASLATPSVSACQGLPAAAAPVVDAQTMPPEVAFANFGYRQDGTAGPYEPDKAARMGVNGVAVTDCQVGSNGTLNACTVVSETPTDYGFGDAVRLMVERHAITAPPGFSHEPDSGRTHRFTVPFWLPGVPSRLPRGGYPANEAYYPAIDAANAGDLASATQAFGEEIKIHLDNAAAYFNRGVALEAEGQHEQAISDYGQALKIISGRPEVSFSMKGAYLIDGQPDNFFILYARAGAYSTMGQVDLAMADYTRAIDIKPDFADALV